MAKSKKKQKKYSSSSSSESSTDTSSSSSSSSSSSDERSKHKRLKKRKCQKSQKKSKQSVSRTASTSLGPVLPTNTNTIGPVLPSHLLKRSEDSVESIKASDMYGPVIPTSVSNTNQQIGPALPPHMLKPKIVAGPPPPIDDGTHGPSLPPNLLPGHADEDTDVVGPLPEGMIGESSTQRALEMRALLLKHEMNNKKVPEDDGTKQREAWMLELPPESTVILGLGPRTFRAKEGPDMSNRSEWTDTPTEKAEKQRMLMIEGEPPPNPEEERKKFLIAERDRTMEQMIEKCKKSKKHKRDKSLMEIHQKKLKKKQKKKDKERGDKPPERRPFDRDLDLQANKFDDAAKKRILNKAQLLNSRFSTGESKFL